MATCNTKIVNFYESREWKHSLWLQIIHMKCKWLSKTVQSAVILLCIIWSILAKVSVFLSTYWYASKLEEDRHRDQNNRILRSTSFNSFAANVADRRLWPSPQSLFKVLDYRNSVVFKLFLVLIIQIWGINKMLLRLQTAWSGYFRISKLHMAWCPLLFK